jgi:hypothetical protein
MFLYTADDGTLRMADFTFVTIEKLTYDFCPVPLGVPERRLGSDLARQFP